jgi:hypothetical protein
MAMSMVMSTLGSHERTRSRENNASSELHSDHLYPGISLLDAVITRPVVLYLNAQTRPVKGLLGINFAGYLYHHIVVHKIIMEMLAHGKCSHVPSCLE